MPFILSLIRMSDYVSSILLLGFIFFSIFIQRASLSRRWTRFGFGAVFCTSLFWMLASCVEMADDWNFKSIWYAMSKTAFAHWWCYRLLISLLGFVLTNVLDFQRKSSRIGLLTLAALIPIFSSMTSHAAMSETTASFRIGIDYLHVFSVSVWAGGLGGIYILLHRYLGGSRASIEVYPSIKRFAHFAMVSTGLLMISGLLQVYLTESSISILWASLYGKLLLVKLVLFSAALLAAAVNQFKHLARWKPGKDLTLAYAVKREIAIELAIIFIIFGVTSILTRTNLPGLSD